MFRVGSLTLKSNLFLSPLAGYTNLPFRLIIREIGGVGLCTTDLVNARSLLEKNRKVDYAVQFDLLEAAIRRVTGARAERITAEQVFQLAAGGDPIAQRVIEDVYTYLGIALANIVYLINPGLIVLGGQVALAGELLIAPLQARVDNLCLPVVGQSVRIVQSKHGSEANIVGAVTLALQDV